MCLCVWGEGCVATAVPFNSVIKDAVGKETSISDPQKECINVCVEYVCEGRGDTGHMPRG